LFGRDSNHLFSDDEAESTEDISLKSLAAGFVEQRRLFVFATS